jgi:zinc finger HIT domain-containing protein 1
MPHVEVLPNSAAAVAPGWTYVVDTGYDPSKVAINPKNKKRAAAQPSGLRGDGDLSARQQTAIARRIAELERDNDVKQTIAVPSKYANVPKTQNARRIIQYQRQIKHWLDEEDAQLAHLAQLPPAPPPRTASSARRQSNMPSASSVPPTPRQATPAPTPTPTSTSLPTTTPQPLPAMAPLLDDDALLSMQRSVPPPLSAAQLDALLAAPPLPYAASHAAPPSAQGPPQRRFCDNCGYWGHIKCRKCGATVCGLECKDAHEATRCLKWA